MNLETIEKKERLEKLLIEREKCIHYKNGCTFKHQGLFGNHCIFPNCRIFKKE